MEEVTQVKQRIGAKLPEEIRQGPRRKLSVRPTEQHFQKSQVSICETRAGPNRPQSRIFANFDHFQLVKLGQKFQKTHLQVWNFPMRS